MMHDDDETADAIKYLAQKADEFSERRRDDWEIRNVIGEYFDAYSDRPFESADALTRKLWDAGFVIVRNYTGDL